MYQQKNNPSSTMNSNTISHTKKNHNLKKKKGKEDMWMVNKHIKRFWLLFFIREIQIKTTVTYNYTSTKRAKTKKWDYTKC